MPKTTFAGQPLHPQMIGAPASLLPFSLILDVLYLVTRKPAHAQAAYYSLVAGCICGAAAAIAGALDYLSIPRRTSTRHTANVHASLNLSLIVLYSINLLLRRGQRVPTGAMPLVLSLLGNGILTVSAWYGTRLVYTHGMRVEGVSPVERESELKLPGDGKVADAFGQLLRIRFNRT